MVLFNYSTKELTAKIVYYGPGLCGKTTNLEFIYESLPEDKRGRMLSLSTQTDRTLYFDFLPVELGDIRGMKTRVQLYTVPGQVFYNETRRLVLKGVDGIVFVADSQSRVSDANIESFRNLEENLKVHGLDLADIPMVLQFNKRDLPDIHSVEEMNAELNRYNAPFYEVIATTGIGVHDTLKAISKLVLRSLNTRYDGTGSSTSLPEAAPGEETGTINEMTSTPEPEMPTALSDSPAKASGGTVPPPVKTPQPDEEWETPELASALDQMDATEIQGLLEEVDSFGTDETDSFTAPDPSAETSFDTVLPEPNPPADDSLSAAPETPDSSASQEEPAPSVFTLPETAPSNGDAPAGSMPAVEDDNSTWMGAPDEAEDKNLTSLADHEHTSLPAEPSLSDNGEGESELTFENFMEQHQDHLPDQHQAGGESLEPLPPDFHLEASTPELHVDTRQAQEDLVTALPEAGDNSPTLHSGTPAQNANGQLRVPIKLEMGGQEYTYILTVTLQPQSQDPS